MRILSWYYGDSMIEGKVFWFRVFGYGLHFKKRDSRMLFSERNGYVKTYTFCGIRAIVLKPSDIDAQ